MAVNKNKIVALAQRYTAKGQFEKAIAEYRKLLGSDPADIRTWLKMGDLYTRMGARKEATETYIRVAEQYTKSGFHLKAIAVYKQVLNLDPTLVVIHKYLAASYMELGLTSEALIQLEQLADVYQRTGKKELLLETLLQMGNIDPHNIATRLRIAELLSEENRVREATKHFAMACEELKSQGRRDDYIKVAARLFYHDPSRVDIAREIAEAYIERRQYKEALSKLQACFLKSPKDVEILRLLALAFKGLEQPDKVVSVYEEIYGVLTHPRERRAVLDEILALDPDNPKARALLNEGSNTSGVLAVGEDSISAVIQSEFPGNMADAVQLSESSEEAGAQPDEVIQNRSKEILEEVRVLLKYGMKERALDHLTKIYEFDPYNIDARELNKDILLEMNNREEALKQLFLLADVFKKTQPEGSVYYLHEILRIDSSNEQAKQMILGLGGIMPEGIDESSVSDDDEEALLLEEEEDIVLIDDADLKEADRIIAEDEVDLDDSIEDWDEPITEHIPSLESADLTSDAATAAFALDAVMEEEVVIEDDGPRQTKEGPLASDESGSLPKIDDDLEEIEFFVSQELFDEARGLLEELLSRHPDDPRLKALEARLSGDADEPEEDDGPIVEIGEDPSSSGRDDSVQFKNVGLQEKISLSDAATNWDLGLAYKEMGLYDDAIQAFEVAARDPGRTGSAKTMIGVCFAALNQMEDAIKTFEEGLTKDIADPQQKMGLLYELGKTYQMMKRSDDALECFQKIYKMDKTFADIRSRIAALSGGKNHPATV